LEAPLAESDSDDDFMRLAGGDPGDNLDDDDDIANGFIEVDFADEIERDPLTNGLHPGGLHDELTDRQTEHAEPHGSKDRPPGW
jgi:hypothetical protein